MKKILLFLNLIFISIINVNASSFNLTLSANSSNVIAGEEVNINISLNNIVDIPNGLNVCQATLTSSGLSIIQIQGKNNWNVTNGNVIIFDTANSTNKYTVIGNIHARILNNSNISLSNIICTDGENEYTTSNASINFTIKEKEPQSNSNNTVTGNINDDKCQNNTLLKTIKIDEIPLEFTKNNYDYYIEVENKIDKITLHYESEIQSAKITKVGNDNLKVGENKIQLIVQEGNCKSIYNIIIKRKDIVLDVKNDEEEILSALKQEIDTLKVKVDISDDKNISSAVLSFLKEHNKNIIYEIFDNNKKVYSVKIFGNSIDNIDSFDLNIRFSSNYKNTLDTQFNGNFYQVINFDYRGILPTDTEITFYNLNIENPKLYLYDYIQSMDKIKYIEEISNNQELTLILSKTSEYVLSTHLQNNNKLYIFAIITTVFILILIGYMLYKYFFKKIKSCVIHN